MFAIANPGVHVYSYSETPLLDLLNDNLSLLGLYGVIWGVLGLIIWFVHRSD